MNAFTILNVVTIASVAVFALRSPFNETHQRRVFLLGSDNVRSSYCAFERTLRIDDAQITSHERYLHVSAADGAPGFEQLVNDIAANFGVVGTEAVQEDMSLLFRSVLISVYRDSSFLHTSYHCP